MIRTQALLNCFQKGDSTRIMKKTNFYLLFLTLFIFQGQVFAEEAKTRLENYLNDITTFEASFEQSLISESNGLQEISKGDFFLSRPGKFRWNYSQPYEQSIIADGKKIWIYDKDLAQVTVRKMDKILADSPALLLSNEVEISEQFVVTKMPNSSDSKGQEWFMLKPKDQDKQYADIRLAFEKANLKVMELRDNFGQLTRIIFSDQKRNQKIDQKLFNFIPPAGVDVLDAGS